VRRGWAPQLLLGAALLALGWGSTLTDTQPFARYWFQLTWAGWTITADAIVLARAGRSLLRDQPGRMVLLGALSAGFWWLFELVNWHLGNWVYAGEQIFGPVARVVLKTLAFATVLPALAEVRDLLRSFVPLPGTDPAPLAATRAPRLAAWMIGIGVAGALGLWLLPRQAFPMAWVSPFLLLDAVAALRGRVSAAGAVLSGAARPVLLVMAAGLITGVLWELWNWGADPHWVYRVPYVGFGKVFQMPILGYGGYLPFALTADAAVRLLLGGRGGLTTAPLTDLGGSSAPAPRTSP
jgi:hypothetical protein